MFPVDNASSLISPFPRLARPPSEKVAIVVDVDVELVCGRRWLLLDVEESRW